MVGACVVCAETMLDWSQTIFVQTFVSVWQCCAAHRWLKERRFTRCCRFSSACLSRYIRSLTSYNDISPHLLFFLCPEPVLMNADVTLTPFPRSTGGYHLYLTVDCFSDSYGKFKTSNIALKVGEIDFFYVGDEESEVAHSYFPVRKKLAATSPSGKQIRFVLEVVFDTKYKLTFIENGKKDPDMVFYLRYVEEGGEEPWLTLGLTRNDRYFGPFVSSITRRSKVDLSGNPESEIRPGMLIL